MWCIGDDAYARGLIYVTVKCQEGALFWLGAEEL